MLFILADPVDHVRGTALLTEYFRSRGADAAVAPLHVEPQDLRTVLNALRCLQNVAGFGITIPHKIAVVPLLDSITERAAHIGAVNFVRRDGGGRLHGDNIDGIGFLAGLQAAGIDPRGMTVLQVGAGGAGRAIAFALAAAGVGRLQITNRSMDKAMGLAASVQRAHPGCSCDGGGDRDSGYDLVVNTTSLGMRPGDVFPLPPESLTPGTIVAEVIMSPEVTPLMEAAQARNCRVVPGKAMLIGQMDAAARFAGLWD
jgi:shikimate dehydrogenase